MAQRNIFVLGLNAFNREKLERIRHAGRYRFRGILDPDAILEGEHFPIDEMLAQAEREIAATGVSPDAIIGYVDFPVSTMLPLLAERFGVRAASLESLLKCEHKYWSRCVQQEVVPGHIPAFQAFDPFAEDAADQVTLDYPFWVKPVKSAGSFLGFRVHDRRELEEAIATIREHIGIFADPFNRILDRAALPPEIARVDGNHCIAEAIIGGRQCTLEGYVQDGRVRFHGVIDSIRARNRSTFLRYQYPSRLPVRVRKRMKQVTRKVLGHIGFEDSAFNIEFFWEPATDAVWLLEINTRVAQHHSDLFEKVDGVSNHEVVVDVALGQPVEFPHREGPFRYAACCWLRRYRDGRVERVPSEDEVATLEREVPGLVFEPHVRPGERLSELSHQESYSYVLGLLYVGGESPHQVVERYRYCKRRLRFRIRD